MSTTMTTTRFENKVILASAGSGKTFQLSNRFLGLLLDGVPVESILATTFTRKGAGEILDRVIQRLARAAASDEGAQKLAGELGLPDDVPAPLTQERAQELLCTVMRSLHRLNVGTLDSFFNRIAQSFSLEIGLPHEWTIAPQQQMLPLIDEAIAKVLEQDDVLDLLHKMHKGDTPTTVAQELRELVANLYDWFRTASDEAWRVITFPNDARELSEQELNELELRLHQWAEGSSKQLANRLRTDAQLVAEQKWDDLLDTTIVKNVASGNYRFGRTQLADEVVEGYERLVGHLKHWYCLWLKVRNEAIHDFLTRFSREYETLKSHLGRLRFDDVTHRLAGHVTSRLDGAGQSTMPDTVAYRLDHHVEHLLLDEFQDTSLNQWNVIKPFAVRTTVPDSERSFFCVGDVKQSIYGWRGGVPELLEKLPQTPPFKERVKDEKLQKSYRSAPAVIDVVNRLFQDLSSIGPTSERDSVAQACSAWDGIWEPHETAKQNYNGWVTVDKCRAADKDAGESNKDPVYERTVERVVAAVRDTESFNGTIGVLVRANDDVSQLIYRLKREGIEASEEGGSALTDSAAVNLILDLLKVADHPRDTIALFHLSHSPIADKLELEGMDRNSSANVRGAAHRLAQRVRREWTQEGPGATVEKYARMLAPHCTPRERTRLQQLIQEAYRYHSEMTAPDLRLRPTMFREYIQNEFKASDPEPARVRVMTVHQSKGLEFDVVVLPLGLNSSWFQPAPGFLAEREEPDEPYSMVTEYVSDSKRMWLSDTDRAKITRAEAQMIRECLCVLYVAVTRAAHALHIVLSNGDHSKATGDQGLVVGKLNGFDKCDFGDKKKTGEILSHGDPNWFKNPGIEPQPEPDLNRSEYYLPKTPAGALATETLVSRSVTGRGVPLVGPSSLEGGDWMVLRSIFGEPGREFAMERGTLIHACFEQVEWIDESEPTQDELTRVLARYVPGHTEPLEIIEQFRGYLQQANVRTIVSRMGYRQQIVPTIVDPEIVVNDAVGVELFREVRIAVPVDSQILNGAIDRLVLVRAGNELIAADVIDYKTDTVADEDQLQEAVERYRPQIDAYRLAVARQTGLPIERVHGRLVFVSADRIVPIA